MVRRSTGAVRRPAPDVRGGKLEADDVNLGHAAGQERPLPARRRDVPARLTGRRINISAVGRGAIVLDGDERYADTGMYSPNGEEFLPVPYERIGLPLLPEPVEGRGEQQPATILVVEDEASIASFVALYLKNAGYGVQRAATGRRRSARSRRPSRT